MGYALAVGRRRQPAIEDAAVPTRRLNFTNRALAAVPFPERGRVELKDDGPRSERGLYLTVGRRSRTFFFVGKVDGRTVRYRIGDFPAVAVDAARRRARELAAQAAAGTDPNTERRARKLRAQTFGEAYRQHVADALARPANARVGPWRDGTVTAYAWAYRTHLAGFEDRTLDSIKPADVRAWISTPSGRSKAPSATAVVLASALWDHAIQTARAEGAELPANPFADYRRSLADREPRSTIIEPDELAPWLAALEAVATPVAHDLVRVLLFAGLRKSEAAALQWQDVNLGQRILTVQRTLYGQPPKGDGRAAAGAVRVQEGTKNGQRVTLPIGAPLVEVFERRRPEAPDPSAWVFPSAENPARPFQSPEHALERVGKLTGVKVSPHDLRRTFTTMADRAGVTLQVIEQLTNHRPSRKNVTLHHYVKRRTVGELRAELQRVTDAMLAAAGRAPDAGSMPSADVVEFRSAK